MGDAVQVTSNPGAVVSHVLERHARTIVRLVIAQHAIRDVDMASGISAMHDRVSRVLHEITLQHGTDAMSTAAEYAASSLEAGSLYPGDDLEAFLRSVAEAARATSKELAKHTPFGS